MRKGVGGGGGGAGGKINSFSFASMGSTIVVDPFRISSYNLKSQ